MENSSLVLIVDDEPGVRQGLQALLEPEGYRLAFATNGHEALARAEAEPPDLILLDLMMPGMNGYEVCQRLRSNPPLAEVPIIMITALDDRDVRIAGIEAGVDEFVSKPFDRQELRARVRTITRLNRYRRLMTERARTEQVIELAPDGIVIVDGHLEIRLANGSFKKMVQANSTDSPVGAPLTGYVSPEHIQKVASTLGRLFARKEGGFEIEVDLMCSGGQLLSCSIAASYFSWDNLPAAQLNIRDISQRKQAQEQMLRTQRLHSIGTLAGGIAHDLNNCLTPILGCAQMLKEGLPAATASTLIDSMEKSARRGAGILKQILVFARGVDGQRDTIQVKYLVEEVRQIVTQTFPKNIQVQAKFGPGLRPVLGDVTQLHQVLMNLSVNARDAMPHGGTLKIVSETVTLNAEDTSLPDGIVPGPFVRISVSDTGTGMSKEILDRIFEPFFTTKEVGKGTGLGLSTAIGIVKSHGGFLRVESQPGRGSTFFIHLPAGEANQVEVRGGSKMDRPRGQGEWILLADDDPEIREVFSTILVEYGYQVVTSADGADAIGRFVERRGEIRAVLLDAVMPIMDGMATLRAMQVLAPGLRPVVMCGLEERDRFEELHSQQKVEFLTKPFDVETLLLTLRDLIHTQAPTSQSGK